MTLPRPLPEGGISFTWHKSVATFNVPLQTFLSTRPLVRAAATGALVFSRAAGEDRVLLIQRAPHDSMPLRWEVPGGACDQEDETLLHSLARELWEEAGLKLKHVVRKVGDEFTFLTRRGLAVTKVTFETEIEEAAPAVVEEGSSKLTLPEVTIDPNEHVRFVWATEEECQAEKIVVSEDGGNEVIKLEFTTKNQKSVVLLGFRLRREDLANGRVD
ncbi:uncharacterized protein CTHT_0071810 [Thermochaetoides thermophila DSM 1495]|uniref:Nudix hydrolase domain-containing protein n=1 Tax=Chaetomium thermophilum (strain DSM 1495 / CBS 144.50 / IMI 039719) TaxID=759272 RepID=G0SFR2_CHATD|nr:hypothetical protein CTHT_0071810 [Thermochaetoides thermophila DSM 1495]EGS17827.1 hypothetical protein CTHT_0071810 [Thermochaetoides thermophila DSM 1495]